MKPILFFLLFTQMLISSTVHLSMNSSPSKLNPLISTDSASSVIGNWIFSSLITYDKDGQIKMELAKSYQFINDTTLRFTLREDISWSDGVPFTAEDVKFTYDLIHSPKVYTPYTSTFRYVKEVKVLDKFTLEITYKEPYFKALETWMTNIVPKHKLLNEEEIMTSKFNQKPIGTGKYTINGFEVSKDVKLVANQTYFERVPSIDNIIYHFIPDPATEFLMLKSQKLDIGTLTPLQYERQLDETFKRNFNFFEKISNGYSYLGFNFKNKKFQDPRVREALSLGIDRNELVDILFFGHGQVCHGPFMPGTFAYDESVKSPNPNLQKAKALLKEAGYDEKNPLSFEIITNSNNPIRVNAAQIIQYQLAKVGVKVKLRTMEWQAFLNTVVMPRKFEAVLLAWSLSLMPDAYSIWHSSGSKKGGFNFIGYKNEKVDALITQASRTVDKEKLAVLYQEIYRLIVKDNPYLFLYISNTITVVNKDIKNVSQSIIGVMHNFIDWVKP
ncbi:MAG: peptide-binding protein [Epsilonproteobacteria bacterium]|nr:peptide-binding protein [Campylobacterota bacterium]